MLWSYAKSFEKIKYNYENKKIIFIRDDPNAIVSKLEQPEICAFSCYTWNWEINLEVSKLIKLQYPNSLIVFGGPHVPDNMTGFFSLYPFVDIAVHGEGEVTFYEILNTYLNDKPQEAFENLPGITFNNGSGKVKPFKRRDRIENIDCIPSPYLTGVFDNILEEKYKFQPIWETNRGCPYSCKYCDWGSSIVTKIKLFNVKRLEKEIKWFGKNKMSFIFGADANFGIFPRDIGLAKNKSI